MVLFRLVLSVTEMNPFSILLVTWNSLEYLKAAIGSIRHNSSVGHEVLVHINEGIDGTIEWVEGQGIPYTRSSQNVGIIGPTNKLALRAKHKLLYMFDDDMVLLPGWDVALERFCTDNLVDPLWFLNSTMVGPSERKNWSVSSPDYWGPMGFDECRLLRDLPSLTKGRKTVVGTHWPCLLDRRCFLGLGGLDERFGLGIGADDDLAARYWGAGCRNFVVVPDSFCYHVGSRSVKKVEGIRKHRQERDRQFRMIHGEDRQEFFKNKIVRGTEWVRAQQ